MNKLLEVSVSGSTYYFLNPLDLEQLANIQRLSKQLYVPNPSFKNMSDDAIIEHFILKVQQVLDISLTKISVAAVIVIK